MVHFSDLFLSYDADRDGSLRINEFVPLASAIGQTPQLSKHDIFDVSTVSKELTTVVIHRSIDLPLHLSIVDCAIALCLFLILFH